MYLHLGRVQGGSPIRLEDLLQRTPLARTIRQFTEATGLTAQVTREDGLPLVITGEFQPFCRVIRSCPAGTEACRESYRRAGLFAHQYGGPYVFKCHAGLVQWAYPVVVEEQYLGAVICGQVLMWKPDPFLESEVLELNAHLGLDTTALLGTLRELPVISPARVQAAAHLMFSVCDYVLSTTARGLAQEKEIERQRREIRRQARVRDALEEVLHRVGLEKLRSPEEFTALENEVRAANVAGAVRAVEALFLPEVTGGHACAAAVRLRAVEALTRACRAALESGALVSHVADVANQYLAVLKLGENVTATRDWLAAAVRAVIACVPDSPDRGCSLTVKAIRYIQDNFHRHIGVKEVAERLFVSPGYLGQVFRLHTGLSMKEFINRTRIARAKEWLARSNLPVGSIAEKVGYTDPGYFCRVFKRVVGKSPGQYRDSTVWG